MDKAKIIFEFPDDNAAGAFIAWFMDGGGEYSFLEGEEMSAEDDERPPIKGFKLGPWNDEGTERVVTARTE
jgi:hypothetical protein